MQNYRNNAMPYNIGYGNNYASNYRRTSERCTAASETLTSCNDNMVLAMAYVKWQTWQNIYETEKALCQGTIFEELDLPFCGIGGRQK